MFLFLFAIQLLGAATDAVTPVLRRVLRRIVTGDSSALGLGWFASYVLANGSVVAILSLSLFRSDLIVQSELFMMIAGTRLGGAAVVVFIGAFDFLNEEIGSLRDSMRLGVLTFLLTHSIFVPAMVLGYLSVPLLEPAVGGERAVLSLGIDVPDLVSGPTVGVLNLVGPGVAFGLAVGAILLSFQLFDGVLDAIDKERLRRRYITKLNDKWLSFGIGTVVTAATTSVAFSIGVIVPLYNRGHIKRTEVIPFVLGANVATLTDTLVAAVAFDTPGGVVTVVTLILLGLSLSVLVLFAFDTYSTVIGTVQETLLSRGRYFYGFLLSLLVGPLLLFVI